MQGMVKQGEDRAIDALRRSDALSVMLASHLDAVASVAPAQPALDAAADAMAATLLRGATLFYVAAGSSGLMALADASELPGTFGIAPSQIRVCMAGGVPVDGIMPGHTEDDPEAAHAGVQDMRPGDLAVVVSASGTTPYALAFAEAARAQGHTVVAIANVAGSPLLATADVPITLSTAPEVVEGSTRLGAATAQKVALNMISTQAGILLGHVHEGMMVNLNPDNIKLRKRAAAIVAKIATVPGAEAERALDAAEHDTKLAILIASGAAMPRARELLSQAGGRLGECLPLLAAEITIRN
ncbi:MAG: N-acetylmuramic acid 6-phosphate etherase [Jannaschia sp.]